jgi:hypothetical protein
MRNMIVTEEIRCDGCRVSAIQDPMCTAYVRVYKFFLEGELIANLDLCNSCVKNHLFGFFKTVAERSGIHMELRVLDE